jgi:hypothetical protein
VLLPDAGRPVIQMAKLAEWKMVIDQRSTVSRGIIIGIAKIIQSSPLTND